MQIVDAQIHVWGTGLPSNMAHWQVTSFTAAEAVALMDEAGVDAAVIHPPSWDPGSTRLAMDAVATYPGRFAIIGAVDLGQPVVARAAMETWREQPGRDFECALSIGPAKHHFSVIDTFVFPRRDYGARFELSILPEPR